MVDEEVSIVRTQGRLVLKRSVIGVRDSGGGKRSLTVLLLGPKTDGSQPNYAAELQVDGVLLCRVDVSALLGALTPEPSIASQVATGLRALNRELLGRSVQLGRHDRHPGVRKQLWRAQGRAPWN